MDKEFFNGMNLDEDISDEDFQTIVEGWEKVQDKISKEDFISKFNGHKAEYEDASFFGDIDFLNMVVNPLLGSDEDGEDEGGSFDNISEVSEGDYVKIGDVEPGNEGFNVVARILSIANPRIFTSRKGKSGKLCNLQIADDTEEVRLVLWTENIKHLKHISEGDIVEVINIECKEGYRGGKEFSLRPRSIVRTIEEDNEHYPEDIAAFPVYEEEFTKIANIVPDETVSIVGRLVRVPTPHSYESNGKKGKVVSLLVQDDTGRISYTLWNNDVKLIESLELKEGDLVKIVNEQSRERNGEISLSHWDGRICKTEGDYGIPEYQEEILKIGEAQEMDDATVLGLVTKVQDVIEFKRADGSAGYVKSLEISDDSGSIRVTLWGDDTKKEISKGDILKVVGGKIEYDDYSNGYRVNTNFNTELIINPDDDSELISSLKEAAADLGPIPVSQISLIEEEGEEVDIIARLINLQDIRKFQRDDGEEGCVRSGDFSDGSAQGAIVRVSFWDEKAKHDFKVGAPYKIENARVKLGLYSTDLNVGKTTRFMELAESEVENLPSLEELEEAIYITKDIRDLDEDDMNVKVLGRILDFQEAREFERSDGTKGLVGNLMIGDESGSIRVSLWDDKTNIPFSVGDAIKIINPRVRYNSNYDNYELSIGGGSNILAPSQAESDAIPDIKELQDRLYESKDIENIGEMDNNIKVKGVLSEIYSGRLLIPKCPHCNTTLDEDDIANEECSFCGEFVDEPRYLLMLSGRLSDDTGEVQATFFNAQVESLLDLKQDDIVSQYEADGDAGAFEGKINDLDGITVEVVANVSFDEFGDDLRLNVNKVLSKEL